MACTERSEEPVLLYHVDSEYIKLSSSGLEAAAFTHEPSYQPRERVGVVCLVKIVFVVCLFFETGSLHCPGCPVTVDRWASSSKDICLPLSPNGIKGMFPFFVFVLIMTSFFHFLLLPLLLPDLPQNHGFLVFVIAAYIYTYIQT